MSEKGKRGSKKAVEKPQAAKSTCCICGKNGRGGKEWAVCAKCPDPWAVCGECNKNDVVSNLHRSRAPAHSKRKANPVASSSSSTPKTAAPKNTARKRKAEQSEKAGLATGASSGSSESIAEMTSKKKRAIRTVHNLISKGVTVTDPHLFAALQDFVAD